MRLVSTVELMAIREKVHNRLGPLEHSISDDTFVALREADVDFRNWFEHWDKRFSEKYPDVSGVVATHKAPHDDIMRSQAEFYRQSLQIQQIFAELFHNATALRGINRQDDVANMPPAQKQIAVRSIKIAKAGLEISLGASAYRENLKYGRSHLSALGGRINELCSRSLYPRYGYVRCFAVDPSCSSTVCLCSKILKCLLTLR